MATQTATTGNLEDAQRIAIAACRYTMEHNMPCVGLVEHFTLAKGEKSITVPKVAQMTARGLSDGVDIAASEDIGMTTTSLTTSEVGLKVILTDKLVRQENEDVFKIVGRQMGNGMARKKDTDVIALFSALNGGTTLGADNKYLTTANAVACIAWAKAAKAPPPLFFVHHPYAIAYLAYQTTAIGAASTTAGYGPGLLETDWAIERIRNFYKITMNGVPFFEDGNIAVISGYESAYGCIASKSAMCTIDSQELRTERERDASLRATEVVVTADYGCFELDDSYGAPCQYEMGAIATNA